MTSLLRVHISRGIEVKQMLEQFKNSCSKKKQKKTKRLLWLWYWLSQTFFTEAGDEMYNFYQSLKELLSAENYFYFTTIPGLKSTFPEVLVA